MPDNDGVQKVYFEVGSWRVYGKAPEGCEYIGSRYIVLCSSIYTHFLNRSSSSGVFTHSHFCFTCFETDRTKNLGGQLWLVKTDAL